MEGRWCGRWCGREMAVELTSEVHASLQVCMDYSLLRIYGMLR